MGKHFLAVALLGLLTGCATVDRGKADHAHIAKKIYGGQVYGHCK